MKITGIICEYDPFHNGHAYLLRQARANSDVVVCVMSGNFTQRGSMAMADKYTRAEAALRGGADLVLELPYPFCSASAEYFASAGVDILSSIGAERICFGSERGDVQELMRVAELANFEAFEEPDEAKGTADGYFAALDKAYAKKYGYSLPLGPNDILAVEYCKAILRGWHDIAPIAVTRIGDGFHAAQAGDTPFASATALRSHIREKGTEGLDFYMPDASVSILRAAMERGDAPVEMTNIESAVLAFFRLADPAALRDIAELGNGLEHRLCEAARQARSLEEFLSLSATKKYTAARIRRAVLYAMTGVRREDIRVRPKYTTLLAANGRGCGLLSALRKQKEGIPVIAKPADAKAMDERQYALSLAADSLFTLAMPKPREAGAFIRKNAIIC